jgi:hypothetical protein
VKGLKNVMQFGPLPLGSLVLENPPLQFANWRDYLETFLQDAGGFALLGLCIWLLATLIRATAPRGRYGPRVTIPIFILIAALASLACYGVVGGSIYLDYLSDKGKEAAAGANPLEVSFGRDSWKNYLFSLGGLIALLGVGIPFILDCAKMSGRRIFALSKLSFVEAVRGRVLFAFLVLLLPFLFPSKWWDPTIKPESQISSNIALIYTGATPIFLAAAALLAAFSIPNDIRRQTIHTVVTKPVQKFEIVIGRFVGYMFLMTLMLLAVTGFSLLMLFASRIDPEAIEESMKARVPLYGELRFQGLPNTDYRGESVGREWEYRRYVPGGGPNTPFRAIFDFFDTDLHSSLKTLPVVNCEFSLDIFRTTKGEEGKGVYCTFFVITHKAAGKADVIKEYRERIKGLSPSAGPNGNEAERRDWERLSQIAGDLGYFEYPSKEIVDYHTQSIQIPGSLFATALDGTPPQFDSPRGKVSAPRVTVAIRCDSRTQFIGVAKHDLYLLAADRNFTMNFFKGALGLWMRLFLVIGIAVTCSTYLNGVVSFLLTFSLTLLGFGRWFIVAMAMVPIGTDPISNPGPSDSLRKLIANEALGVAPDRTNATQQVTQTVDDVFRWTMRRILNVIPNMERPDWEQYVAKGFDVPWDDLLLNFVFILGYLSLWALLGHYLMKWREIATW